MTPIPEKLHEHSEALFNALSDVSGLLGGMLFQLNFQQKEQATVSREDAERAYQVVGDAMLLVLPSYDGSKSL